MRIMTANIWGDYFGNPVEGRTDGLLETFKKYAPDVLGVQELTDGWYDSRLFPALDEEFVLVEGYKGNYTPLLYRRSAFTELARGYEKYLHTPDNSKSITYAVLRRNDTGACIAVCNTHFWWKTGPEHDEIRVKNAQQLLGLMQRLRSLGMPVYAFGDLNCRLAEAPLQYLRENGVLSAVEATADHSPVGSHHGDPQLGEDGRYHGAVTEKDYTQSIDHILTFAGQSVLRHDVVQDRCVLDATDHSPVYIDIE